MLQKISEIKQIIEKNQSSSPISFLATEQELLISSHIDRLCKEKKVKRGDVGFAVSDVFRLLIILPLLMMKTVDSLYKSTYKTAAEMQKDVIYRFQNNERIPWRRLLLYVVKTFLKKTRTAEKSDLPTVFILDDTAVAKRGKRIEGVSTVHNHSENKYHLGYKAQALGYFDGMSFLPLDFSLHEEKKLYLKDRKRQYKKDRHQSSAGAKRKEELSMKKSTSAIKMLKRVTKNGIRASYVLADSWYFGEDLIKTALKLKSDEGEIMHYVGGVKRHVNFISNGKKRSVRGHKKHAIQKKHVNVCRSWRNCRYVQLSVTYRNVPMTLFITRLPGHKNWRAFVTTDTSLSFEAFIQLYSMRWQIEVFFKETKQLLGLGECQSRTFDAQIAAATRSFIIYIMLAYYKRVVRYETIGGLFRSLSESERERNLAERIWEAVLTFLRLGVNVLFWESQEVVLRKKCDMILKTIDSLLQQRDIDGGFNNDLTTKICDFQISALSGACKDTALASS